MRENIYRPCGSAQHTVGRRQFMGDFLTAAGAISAGTSLFSHPLGAGEIARRGKSVVVVFLNGGVSQFESWDPKKDLDTGGPFKAIPTTVPGIHISELLPNTAKQMHHMALIRSINSGLDDHGLANNIIRTGRTTRSATEYPELGSVVAKGLERPDYPLPGHIATMLSGVGGRAKGIEHLEDLVFRKGSRGVDEALAIIQQAAEAPQKTTSVKWDGKPAVIFGRKPATGEFVLTDGSGFDAKGYDGLATSPKMMAQIQSTRKGERGDLNQIYADLWPQLEAAVPTNFRGYVKGDLLYYPQQPWEEQAGNLVFKPNTVQYRIPAKSALGQKIRNSTTGIAMHTMYADQGEPKQPLSRVSFNEVPGLLLIEPIYGKGITPQDPAQAKGQAALIKQIKQIRNSKGAAIDTLFNPAELRAMQITDLAKLCVDYINFRVKQPDGNFDNLLAGFGEWLQTKVTPKKFGNIVEYLKSPASNTEGLAAAFTLFILLHDLKLDILRNLDLKDPGHEGWVMATPAGYGKAVNRFDFTARNAAQNNRQPA